MNSEYLYGFFRHIIEIPILKIQFKVGIWQICTSICTSISCSEDDPNDVSCKKLYIIRSIFILTCIISLISSVFFLIFASSIKNINQKFLLIIKIFVFISLLMGILSVIFTIIGTQMSQYKMLKMKKGLSTYLGILAICIHFLATSLSILIKQ